MEVVLESTFQGSIGVEAMELLRGAEERRQSAVDYRARGMRASNNGEWKKAAGLYARALHLFETIAGINVDDEINISAVLLACVYERWTDESWWELIEMLYAKAKGMDSQFCGDIAHFVFALRIKYGDLDEAGIALAERERFGFPVATTDWEILDLEYSRSLLSVKQD